MLMSRLGMILLVLCGVVGVAMVVFAWLDPVRGAAVAQAAAAVAATATAITAMIRCRPRRKHVGRCRRHTRSRR